MINLAKQSQFQTLPLQTSQRLKLLDIVRGVAVLGILIMNVPYFGLPYLAYYDLRILNETQGINAYVWRIMMVFFEGSMRALLCLLFGAGMILLTERLDKKNIQNLAADIYYRRLFWLIVFGVVDEYLLLWPGDILFPYAIAGLFLFPFRKNSANFLIRGFICCMLTYTLSVYVKESSASETRTKGLTAIEKFNNHQHLTNEEQDDIIKWKRYNEDNSLEGLKQQAALQKEVFKKGYGSISAFFAEINIEIQSAYLYLFAFWDYLGFMLLGMALYKLKFITGEQKIRLYFVTMIIAYVIGIAAGYYHVHLLEIGNFDTIEVYNHKIVDVYQIHRLGLGIGDLCFIILLFKLQFFKKVFSIFAIVGRMALTNYFLQNIICTFFFFGYGLGYFDKFQRYQLYYIGGIIWVIEILFSVVWLNYYNMGPLEWLWRCLTYKKWLPLKRIQTI
jgi:uncharacterized protein